MRLNLVDYINLKQRNHCKPCKADHTVASAGLLLEDKTEGGLAAGPVMQSHSDTKLESQIAKSDYLKTSI